MIWKRSQKIEKSDFSVQTVTTCHDVPIGLFFDKSPLSSCFMTRFREKNSTYDSETEKIGFSQKRSFFPIFTPKSYNTLQWEPKNPIKLISELDQKIEKSDFLVRTVRSSHDVAIGLFFDKITLSSCFVTCIRQKSPSNDSKSEKNQLFSIFNVDHFSRLLQTQNNPKIFLGRFALKLKKKSIFLDFHPKIL